MKKFLAAIMVAAPVALSACAAQKPARPQASLDIDAPGEVLIGIELPDADEWDIFRTGARGVMWRPKDVPVENNAFYEVRLLEGVTFTLEELKKQLDRPGRVACHQFSSIPLERTEEEGFPYLFWRTECEVDGRPRNEMIHLLIAGDSFLYQIARNLPAPVSAHARADWIGQLGRIEVCDNGVSDRRCPEDREYLGELEF